VGYQHGRTSLPKSSAHAEADSSTGSAEIGVTETSSTCPDVEVRYGLVWIGHDFNGPHSDRVTIDFYDMDAFAEQVVAARDRLRREGHRTAWSSNADGAGNCGAIYS
jgi:hypothetical protein